MHICKCICHVCAPHGTYVRAAARLAAARVLARMAAMSSRAAVALRGAGTTFYSRYAHCGVCDTPELWLWRGAWRRGRGPVYTSWGLPQVSTLALSLLELGLTAPQPPGLCRFATQGVLPLRCGGGGGAGIGFSLPCATGLFDRLVDCARARACAGAAESLHIYMHTIHHTHTHIHTHTYDSRACGYQAGGGARI